MKIPLQITFRNMERSEALERTVEERAGRLERYFDRIMGCRVIIEAPHRRRHQGKQFHVRIDLTVPGQELVVGRDPAKHGTHEDMHVAIRDAFKAARRALQDYVRRMRGMVKTRVVPPEARVVRLFANEGYGFLETPDGREVYFHENSVLDGFERLAVGSEVRFKEEKGEEGPQASTVTRAARDKRRPAARRPAPAAEVSVAASPRPGRAARRA